MSQRGRRDRDNERRSLVPLDSEPMPLIAGHIANEKVREGVYVQDSEIANEGLINRGARAGKER
jgi:hypothetical protein